MGKCPHCNGTGVAPKKITFSCICCQAPVKVVYTTIEQLRQKAVSVLCAECQRVEVAGGQP